MIDENQKIELFEDFYNWLVADGLKAKKSERLYRKKIFASLMANNEMTLDNFKDFLVYRKQDDEKRDFIRKIENLDGKLIFYNDCCRYISEIEIFEHFEKFKFAAISLEMVEEKTICFNCKFLHLEKIEKMIIKSEF